MTIQNVILKWPFFGSNRKKVLTPGKNIQHDSKSLSGKPKPTQKCTLFDQEDPVGLTI